MIRQVKNRLVIAAVISVYIFNNIFTQDCDDGFTYYDSANIPSNVNVLDNSNCFSSSQLSVLDNLITLNALDYDSPLEVGVQTWVENHLYFWVATYTQNGVNGLNQQLTQLPDNIGELSSLRQLFLEWNNLMVLPDNFTQLLNLKNLAISNNWLTSLPTNFGEMSNLEFVDLGYNQITDIPESIGILPNIEYLWLFNNQLTSLPESICDLPLTWSGTDSNNYPYFASGGNQLCDSDLVPDCVENSSNFESTLDQFYYSFLLDAPQDCESECSESGDVNDDGFWNVLDIVILANCVLANNCFELPNGGCAGDVNDDGFWNVLDIVTLANCVLENNCGA